MSANFPRGAGLGRDADRRRPGLVDFDWTMQHGGRAQRREILRQLKAHKRQGNAEAGSALDALRDRYSPAAGDGAAKVWRIALPGRAPFRVICPQLATAAEILAQWTGADVEAVHD